MGMSLTHFHLNGGVLPVPNLANANMSIILLKISDMEFIRQTYVFTSASG